VKLQKSERSMKKGSTPINILIVEDEALIAMDLRLTVESMGFKALGTAFSGEESLRKVESLHPDVVLMDIKLKGDMDGLTAAEEIYARFGVPVIYLSAYTDDRTLYRTRRPGSCGCLPKPFEPVDLQNAIDRCAEARAM
jgi:CheY-like chemotaxis protein